MKVNTNYQKYVFIDSNLVVCKVVFTEHEGFRASLNGERT